MSEWIDLNDKAPTWDKKEPVQGFYTHKQENVGPNSSNLYTLKTDKGDVGVWGSTVIDSKFEQIPTGSEVRIESLGTAEGKNGKEYNDYKVSYREAPLKEVDMNDLKDAGLI
jgi:hypothetical protein